MKNLLPLFFFLICQTVYCQVKIPTEIETRIVRIKDMSVGEKVQTLPEALLVDENGNCWLDPNFVAYPLRIKSELEVTKTKLGYVVRVNYIYKKLDGYAIPKYSKWERGIVPINSIPVKSLVISKPNYGRPSPSVRLSLEMQEPYNPRFVTPELPPNPYSFEKHNEPSTDLRRIKPSSNRTNSSRGATSTNDGILPEIFRNN